VLAAWCRLKTAVGANPHLLDVRLVEVAPLLVGSRGLADGVRGGCGEALSLYGGGGATGLGLRDGAEALREGAYVPSHTLCEDGSEPVATALRH